MDIYLYIFLSVFLLLFLFYAINVRIFFDSYIEHLKILTHKSDRVAASIMQLTDTLKNEYKEFSMRLAEKSKDEIVAEILGHLSKKDGKLKKRLIEELVDKASEELKER